MTTLTPHIEGYAGLFEVGRGGFATAYRARRMADGAIVAVKVLHTWALDDVNRRRFAAELEALQALAGEPGVVPLIGHGETTDGRPYLVMDFMPDGSLADRLSRGGPLEWPEAVALACGIAGALAAAHEAGVLHRDVKPENILRTKDGRWVLADFGLALFADAHLSRTGQIVASISHAAPEVFANARPAATLDVYSLASTLFTVLAGRNPFGPYDDEPSIAVVRRIAEHNPPDLRDMGVPGEVVDLVEQGLAKDPEARPPTAVVFAAALAECGATDPAATRPLTFEPPAAQLSAPHGRLQKRWWAAVAASTAAVAAAGVLTFGPIGGGGNSADPVAADAGATVVEQVVDQSDGQADDAPPPPPPGDRRGDGGGGAGDSGGGRG